MTRKPAIRMRREADLVYPNPVNNGISGDIRRRHLAPSALSRLNGDILRRWETIASVRLQFATVPICSGYRVGHGREIGPWCGGSEIAR